MACFNNYLPQPPRAWSRVQHFCALINEDNIYNENQMAMLIKGNILQHKSNNDNLTKAQKYSKIVNRKWINRNTSWATQSANGYTNPNTSGLKRVGNIQNILIDTTTGLIQQTNEPPTCPLYITTSGKQIIQDGGVLICSIKENICTGETNKQISRQFCNPTSASDVPGYIQELCWNNGMKTWYPRKRYKMTNSGNKWPTNAILLSAVKP